MCRSVTLTGVVGHNLEFVTNTVRVSILAVVAGVVLAACGGSAANGPSGGTSPAPGQLAAADKACVTASDRTYALDESPGNSLAGLGTWKPIAHDVRGVNVLVMLTAPTATATALATCLTGADFRPAEALVGAPAPTAAPGTISGWSEGGSASRRGRGPWVEDLNGAAGAGVTKVLLVLSNGSHVKATVAAGYYAAWWPGHALPVSAEVTTESGTTIRRF